MCVLSSAYFSLCSAVSSQEKVRQHVYNLSVDAPAAAVRCSKIELMTFYFYPGINLENQAMLPKLADSVDPLASFSRTTRDNTTDITHFVVCLNITIQ